MENLYWKSLSKGALVLIFIFNLCISPAMAADGSGTASISPTSATVGSATNTFTTTYTASETMQGGSVKVTAPTGWSAPQLSAGTAGYVTISSTGTIGKVENTMDSLSGWSEDSTLGVVTISADTSVKKEGSASIKAAVLASLGNKHVYYDYGSNQNWSGYSKLSFWFRSSVVLSAGEVKLLISESPALGGATEFSLPSGTLSALTPGTWVQVVVDLSGSAGSTRDAVRSFGWQIPVSALANFYFDSVMLGPSTVPIISGQAIEVPIMELTSTQTVTVNYGAGGGTSGVSVGTGAEAKTIAVQSKVDSGGTYTSIAGSPQVTLLGGPATSLQLTSEPASLSAGLAMTPMVVTLKDQYGNTAGDSSTSVTLGLAAGPSGGALAGTTSVTASNGLATFTNAYATLPGSGYQLSATASGLTTVNSVSTLTALGALITATGGTTAVTEGGATDTFDVVLNAAPTSDVTVSFSHNSQAALNHESITFTTSNWSTPQSVTITAVNDGVLEGSHSAVITAAVTSGDALFNNTLAASITAAITDAAAVASALEFSAIPTISAGLGITSFTVTVLNQYGSALITDNSTSVGLSLGSAPSGGSISGTTTRTVSSGVAAFTGLSIPQAGSGYSLTATAAGLPTVSTGSFTVLGAAINQGGGVSVIEGGASDSFSVQLSGEPGDDVIITFSHDGEITLSDNSLTFTDTDWNIPQTVTVTAVNDTEDEDDDESVITGAVASSDAGFNGTSFAEIAVMVIDNDTEESSDDDGGGGGGGGSSGGRRRAVSNGIQTVTPDISDALVDSVVGPTCPRYGHQGIMVKIKSRGLHAMGVQQAINQMNILDASLDLDGVIGPKSHAGIKMAQQILGTMPDGLWGAVTEGMYANWVSLGCPPVR